MGADVIANDVVEGYVRVVDAVELIGEYGLEPSSAPQGNVHLRVVSEIWPFGEDERVAPALVVAIDLLEDADGRTRRAGRSLLARAQREAPR